MDNNSKTSKINDQNYYVINGWMINRLRLKGVTLSVYAIIYGFSQDGENEFTGSLQYLCDFCGGVSKPTIIKALKELVDSGHIIRREENVNGVVFVRYKANLTGGKEFLTGCKKTLTEGGKETLTGGSKETLPNKETNNKNNNINKDINIIVDFLNEKAGTKYRASSKSTYTHIHARLADGFTVDDFFTVITKKCAEWRGTEFEQYLRPQTLFGTKFESYLNAPTRARKQYGASGVEIKENAEDDLAGIL